ncbi:MAG TPA: sulfatase-like hydrolase/transferase, partial [bacterium]|nr:sulfatase-like hydrolase/transferase [bacterium]
MKPRTLRFLLNKRSQLLFALVLLLPAYFLVVHALQTSAQQQDSAQTQEAKPERFPPVADANIVLLMSDALRADHLGCYGYSRNTSPNIDKLAAEGVVLDRFYSNACWTRPSMGTLFTSKYPGQLGINADNSFLPEGNITLAEALKLNKYTNVGVVTNGHIWPEWGFGRGFDEYIKLQKWQYADETK